MEPPSTLRSFASRYLAFVRHAFNAESGRFRNFMSYGRQWREDEAIAGERETRVARNLNRYDRETFKFVTSQQALDALRRLILDD